MRVRKDAEGALINIHTNEGAQGRRIIKNSGRRIIKNSGRRIIINIRHNYMHDVTRSKSGGVRRNEEE